MSVLEIQAFLTETYGTEVLPDFINSVTDEVMAENIAWRKRRWPCVGSCSSTVAGQYPQ